MKYLITFLLLCVFIFNAWFAIQESYWATNLFLSTNEIGSRFAGDFRHYLNLSHKFVSGENIYEKSNAFATYPPTMYMYFTPFVNMGRDNAYGLWSLMKILSLLLTGWFLASILFPALQTHRKIILTIFIGLIIYIFAPMQDDLNSGQINIFILFLLSMSIYFAVRQKFEWCGIALGLIFSFKLFSLFIIIYFAMKRNWKVVISAIITIMTINIPIIYYYGFGVYVDYLQYFSWAKVKWTTNQNFSIYAQSLLLFNKWGIQPFEKAEHLSQTIHYLFAGFVSFAGYNVLFAKNQKTDYFRDISYIIVITLFVTPYHWSLHHLWLIVPYAYLLDVLLKSESKNWWAIIGLAVLFFTASFLDGNIIVGKWQYLSKIFFNSRAPLIMLFILWELLTYCFVTETCKPDWQK